MIFPRLVLLVLATLLLSGYGQGTEQFIPIGKSPGISGTHISIQGFIISLNTINGTICLDGHPKTSPICLPIEPTLPIYLDRSKQELPSLIVGFDYLTKGAYIEYYPSHWIKVRQ